MWSALLAVAVANAVRVTGPMTDEVWRSVPAVAEVVEREPVDGGEPSERTEFRVA